MFKRDPANSWHRHPHGRSIGLQCRPLGAFLGVTDHATEVNQRATMIQLRKPFGGASYSDKWATNNETQTVDATVMSQDPEGAAQISTDIETDDSLRPDDSPIPQAVDPS